MILNGVMLVVMVTTKDNTMSYRFYFRNGETALGGLSESEFANLCAELADQADLLPSRRRLDDESRLDRADRVREIRDTACSISMTFDCDGETFDVLDEADRDERIELYIDDLVDSVYSEVNHIHDDYRQQPWWSHYITIDEEMMRRDLAMDADQGISHYDGVVHECLVNELEEGTVGAGHWFYLIRTD